jgi:hypothetical protein
MKGKKEWKEEQERKEEREREKKITYIYKVHGK